MTRRKTLLTKKQLKYGQLKNLVLRGDDRLDWKRRQFSSVISNSIYATKYSHSGSAVGAKNVSMAPDNGHIYGSLLSGAFGSYGKGNCLKDHCYHGGTCLVRYGKTSCLCRDDYTGDKCQYRATTATTAATAAADGKLGRKQLTVIGFMFVLCVVYADEKNSNEPQTIR